MRPEAVPANKAGRSSGSSLAGARRVIVLRLDHLGDVVLTGHVFRTSAAREVLQWAG
jgi:hypothetical protein